MRKIVAIVLTLLSWSVFSSGNESFHVSFIGCRPTGICFIGVTPSATQSSCSNGAQLRFNISDPGGDAIYSAAMVAFTTGKQIRAEVTDTCLDSFPSVGMLNVNNFTELDQ
ncbi:hypothetical protein P886_3403 [Alteromonadaceae bacterium 2753L.S.0a.02]|nr:hypothetical protein P886_3403 [Alteromonadaceae bacterium 2753L.S.0a.02]